MADVVLLVVDGREGLGEAERRWLAQREVPVLVLWNKIDVVGCLEPPPEAELGAPVRRCSALNGWGVQALRAELLERCRGKLADTETVVSVRQQQQLAGALAALQRIIAGPGAEGSAGRLTADLCAAELREAAGRLGGLLGEGVDEQVIDSIFRSFCIGK